MAENVYCRNGTNKSTAFTNIQPLLLAQDGQKTYLILELDCLL